MNEPLKIGDTITFNHSATLFEKIKSIFGYKIPELDYYTVVTEATCSGSIQYIEKCFE